MAISEADSAVRAIERTLTVEVVMPAHNEGESIAETIREFYAIAHGRSGIGIRLLVTEDGSSDNTCEVVNALTAHYPLRLISSPERKGYSRAVVDGLRATSADVVCFVDGDGQCDPADLSRLVNGLADYDLVVGYRNPRRDPQARRLMSRAFGFVYRRLFPVRLRDPSCPYIVARREVLSQILEGAPGILKQGFWWEFNARAAALSLRIAEVPVNHRVRTAGRTRVYRVHKLPALAAAHLAGLFALRRELRGLRNGR